MNSSRLPLTIFALLLVGFFGYLALSAGQLPLSVATHFDAEGNPNQWMSRGTHLKSLAFFGFLVPVGELGLFYSMRFFSAKRVNIPNRDFWLAPERREATMLYVFNHGIWLASITVVFMGLLQWSMYDQCQCHTASPLGTLHGFPANSCILPLRNGLDCDIIL
jgi:serine/threonine-protein kinase